MLAIPLVIGAALLMTAGNSVMAPAHDAASLRHCADAAQAPQSGAIAQTGKVKTGMDASAAALPDAGGRARVSAGDVPAGDQAVNYVRCLSSGS